MRARGSEYKEELRPAIGFGVRHRQGRSHLLRPAVTVDEKTERSCSLPLAVWRGVAQRGLEEGKDEGRRARSGCHCGEDG